MAIEPRVVKVKDVQGGIDMRVTRAYLDEKECRQLQPGECIVRVNTRRNMMRIYMGGDQFIEPGMYTAWCRAGHKWNREKIANWMRNSANVELDDIYRGAERVEHTPLKVVAGARKGTRRTAATKAVPRRKIA